MLNELIFLSNHRLLSQIYKESRQFLRRISNRSTKNHTFTYGTVTD